MWEGLKGGGGASLKWGDPKIWGETPKTSRSCCLGAVYWGRGRGQPKSAQKWESEDFSPQNMFFVFVLGGGNPKNRRRGRVWPRPLQATPLLFLLKLQSAKNKDFYPEIWGFLGLGSRNFWRGVPRIWGHGQMWPRPLQNRPLLYFPINHL